MTLKHLRIGTRASQLALWQANWTKSELERRYPGIVVELVKIKTIGDKILDVPWPRWGGRGSLSRRSRRRCCGAKSIWRCTA